jgi:hypothetical protein
LNETAAEASDPSVKPCANLPPQIGIGEKMLLERNLGEK